MFDANDLDLDNGLDALFASAATATRLGTVEIVEEAPALDEAAAAYEDAGLDLAPAARAAWITAARGWLGGTLAQGDAQKVMDAAARGLVACRKCGGAGNLHQYHYVQRGLCFACDGAGFVGA